MFDTLASFILNKILGNYLNVSHLDLSIWNGDINLSDIEVKCTAFNAIGLPFRVVAGNVGKLEMKIPWRSLYSMPVEIILKELFLVAVPSNIKEIKPYDPEVEEISAFNSKMAHVQRLEASLKSMIERNLAAEHNTSDSPQTISFSDKLIAQVIRNLRIYIESIHIRFEDEYCSSVNVPENDCSFSIGIVLTSLVVEATDELWIPNFTSEETPIAFKIVNLHGLALYVNGSGNLTTTDKNPSDEAKADIIKQLGILIQLDEFGEDGHGELDYIVGPISISMHVKLTPNPEKSRPPFSIPKTSIEMIVDKIVLGMSSVQFTNVIRFSQSITFIGKSYKWRKYRPSLTEYREHYKDWWKFAINCILVNIQRKAQNWSWSHIKSHCALCKEYVQALLYGKTSDTYLSLPIKWTGSLFASLDANKERIKICEQQLDIINLILCRKKAELKFARQTEFDERHHSGVLSYLWEWKILEEPVSNELTETLNKPWTQAEKETLIDVAHFSINEEPPPSISNSLSLTFPLEYIGLKAIFRIKELKLVIRDIENVVNGDWVLQMNVQELETRFEKRPSNGGYKLHLKIRSIEILGPPPKSEKETQSYIVKTSTLKPGENLFDICYEKFPLGEISSPQKVTVSTNALEIYNSLISLHELYQFFRPHPHFRPSSSK